MAQLIEDRHQRATYDKLGPIFGIMLKKVVAFGISKFTTYPRHRDCKGL